MFDISWAHLAVIAAVALVVIGPKDLPRVLRTAGAWMARARAVAREFQSSLDQMVREAELEDVRKQVQEAADLNIGHEIEKSIDPGGEMQRSLSQSALTGEASPSAPAGEGALPAPPPNEAAAPTTPAADTDADAQPAPPAASGTHV